MTLPCGHEQQTIEGLDLPCANWRCAGSPGGERYRFSTNRGDGTGRKVTLSRERIPPADPLTVRWKIDEIEDIDWNAVHAEGSARTMKWIMGNAREAEELERIRALPGFDEWLAKAEGK